MPIDLSWYVPLRIMRIHIYDDAGIEDIEQLGLNGRSFLEDGIAPVHVLLDDASALPPPINLQQLRLALNLRSTDTHKLGWVIGVGDVNIMAKVVIPMLMKILTMRYVRVATIEEAVTFLRKHDKSLQAIAEI